MKFYEAISKHYDAIFPLKNAQLSAMMRIAGAPPARVLDLACGTGSYSLALAEKGYNVTASDLDLNMINQLREKRKKSKILMDVKQFNMIKVAEKVKGEYDAVICIGNSLVHLNNFEDTLTCLKGVKKVLKSGGKCLIQIVNYDRVIYHLVSNLPTIINEEANLSFKRLYTFNVEDYRIIFKGILEVDDYQSSEETVLLPMKCEKLVALLHAAGFEKVSLYGGFDCSPFLALESMALVVVAA